MLIYTLWLFHSSPWKITMLLIGKPSIIHGKLLNNQRVGDFKGELSDQRW
jgi:hypothetical protein